MITKQSIADYQGISFERSTDYLYVPPHILLQPYILHYAISFPTPQIMPAQYTVLPFANSTIVVSVDNKGYIHGGMSGVNTVATQVGSFANKMKLLLLIRFRPGGLWPFMRFDQQELTDYDLDLDALDSKLTAAIQTAFIRSNSCNLLFEELNHLLLTRFNHHKQDPYLLSMMKSILLNRGNIIISQLSRELHYSERHLRRLFMKYVGTTPKTFAKISRVNYAIHLLQHSSYTFAEIAAQAGYFDQSHFVHDFQSICGMTPQTYLQNLSHFYNDDYNR